MKCQNCNAKVKSEGRCLECGSIVVSIPRIGKLALRYKTITNNQLSESLNIQGKLKTKIPLEQIWVQKKFADAEQIDLLITIKEFIDLQEQDKAFIKIAINKGFVKKEQVEAAQKNQQIQFRKYKKIRIIGEILVDDKAISLENCNKILKAQKRKKITKKVIKEDVVSGNVDLEREFLGIRKSDEEFAKIAMRSSVATKKDLVIAFKKQINEFKKSNNIKLVGEILFDSGAIEYNQVELILKEQGRVESIAGLRKKYLTRVTKKVDKGVTKNAKGKESNSLNLKLIISDDNLKAYVRFTGEKSERPLLDNVKKVLIENQIKFGVKKKSEILLYLRGENFNEDFLIAEGKPGYAGTSSQIEYFFDTDFFTKKKDERPKETPKVKRGKLLARKTPMESINNGVDVFGNPSPPTDRRLRNGDGTKLSENGLEIISTKTGEPRLSIDNKVYVLTKTNILEDADVRTGPFDCCNFNISGIVTDAFPISGGELKAEEIRGATLDMIGDIVVDIGIVGAKIKTQGSVIAKYIHNSQIEAFGDVITSCEILDSNVLSSGVCRSETSKIVASSVSAKKGIYSKGIGTESSIPCMLNTGVEDHISNEVNEIEKKINFIKDKLEDLKSNKDKFAIKEINLKKKILEKRKLFDQIKVMLEDVNTSIEVYKDKKDKNEVRKESIKKNKIEINERNTKEHLDELTKNYKDISNNFKKASYEYITFQRESEKKVIELIDMKRSYQLWADKSPNLRALQIDGELISGTTISSPNTSVTTVGDYKNVKIL